MPSIPINVSRSQIETRHKCWRERFLGYHKNGTGIAKKGGKYEARFGTILHDWMKNVLLYCQRNGNSVAGMRMTDEYVQQLEEVIALVYSHLPPDQLIHMKKEQTNLLQMLVSGWITYRLPKILNEFTIIDVETETEVTYEPAKYCPEALAQILSPVIQPIRFDCVLRQKHSGTLFIMDFKTTKNANEDWNVNLDNSLQSNLYIEAAELIYGEYCGGIFYEGLVKGYRQVDNANSSPFKGMLIQYGSPLYGWQAKNGDIDTKYVTGKKRVFIPDFLTGQRGLLEGLASYGINLEEYFPNTIPYRPLNIGRVVAQTIVNENNYANVLEMYTDLPSGHPEKEFHEDVLFEKSLGNCFKYGTKHPCQFVSICHGLLSDEEIALEFEPREDHHGSV